MRRRRQLSGDTRVVNFRPEAVEISALQWGLTTGHIFLPSFLSGLNYSKLDPEMQSLKKNKVSKVFRRQEQFSNNKVFCGLQWWGAQGEGDETRKEI